MFIELVYDDFVICKIQGESPHDYNLFKYHIALFSFYEFFPQGFSYKIFNETISIQEHTCGVSYFSPQGFFKEDIQGV